MTKERDDLELLSIRLREQTAKARLAQQGLARVEVLYSSLDEPHQDVVREIETGIQIGERAQTDMFWIVAMQKAGISPEVILKIWDARDEAGRETRDAISG